MPSTMWFGQETHMRAVPAPATGMALTRAGYFEDMSFQNGRRGISRSMQTHQEFNMDFPVQEAQGTSGLDVFAKFASGYFGDCDSYPIFFADPMNYDSNLIAPHFASPGLYRRGWGSIVDDGTSRFWNSAVNPSAEGTITNWTAIAGTSGAANALRIGPVTTAKSGNYYYATQWTTATSAVSGGFRYQQAYVGTSYGGGASIWVQSSKTQRVQATLRARDGGAVSLGTTTSSQTVLTANVWTELKMPSLVILSGSIATIEVEVVAVAGTSAANWAIGDQLRGDALMLWRESEGGEPPYYFDWQTPGSSGADMSGSGSFLFVPRLTPTSTGNTPANSYDFTPNYVEWQITAPPLTEPSPVGTTAQRRIPYVIIPIPPGYTLHVGYSGAVTGTAQVVVEGWTSGGTPTKNSTTVMTPLAVASATRMNTTVAGGTNHYAKIYLRRTDYSLSTATVYGMMAQLWPTGFSPTLTGNHIEGRGHRGLKFTDTASVESYVMVDPYRNVKVHFKGLSTTLVEAQDRG